MCAKSFDVDAAYTEQASSWARSLTQSESRGPGDLENAWRRLEARYGISFGSFWALRYRKPRDVHASIYFRLKAAYEAECERQMRKLQHELSITKTIAGDDHPAVGAAAALVGEDESA